MNAVRLTLVAVLLAGLASAALLMAQATRPQPLSGNRFIGAASGENFWVLDTQTGDVKSYHAQFIIGNGWHYEALPLQAP